MEQKIPKLNDDKDDLYYDCKDKKWLSGRIIECGCRRFGGLMHKDNKYCPMCKNLLYKGEKGEAR